MPAFIPTAVDPLEIDLEQQMLDAAEAGRALLERIEAEKAQLVRVPEVVQDWEV